MLAGVSEGPVVDYATPLTGRIKPTRHSPLAGWAWIMLVLETLYRGTVASIAYWRSPTYPWARFWRNVGDPELFIQIDKVLLFIGVALGVGALLHPHRKRWAAWAALGAHLSVLVIKYEFGLPTLNR